MLVLGPDEVPVDAAQHGVPVLVARGVHVVIQQHRVVGGRRHASPDLVAVRVGRGVPPDIDDVVEKPVRGPDVLRRLGGGLADRGIARVRLAVIPPPALVLGPDPVVIKRARHRVLVVDGDVVRARRPDRGRRVRIIDRVAVHPELRGPADRVPFHLDAIRVRPVAGPDVFRRVGRIDGLGGPAVVAVAVGAEPVRVGSPDEVVVEHLRERGDVAVRAAVLVILDQLGVAGPVHDVAPDLVVVGVRLAVPLDAHGVRHGPVAGRHAGRLGRRRRAGDGGIDDGDRVVERLRRPAGRQRVDRDVADGHGVDVVRPGIGPDIGVRHALRPPDQRVVARRDGDVLLERGRDRAAVLRHLHRGVAEIRAVVSEGPVPVHDRVRDIAGRRPGRVAQSVRGRGLHEVLVPCLDRRGRRRPGRRDVAGAGLPVVGEQEEAAMPALRVAAIPHELAHGLPAVLGLEKDGLVAAVGTLHGVTVPIRRRIVHVAQAAVTAAHEGGLLAAGVVRRVQSHLLQVGHDAEVVDPEQDVVLERLRVRALDAVVVVARPVDRRVGGEVNVVIEIADGLPVEIVHGQGAGGPRQEHGERESHAAGGGKRIHESLPLTGAILRFRTRRGKLFSGPVRTPSTPSASPAPRGCGPR